MLRACPLRVLVHGGAGGKNPTAAQRSCLTEFLIAGMHILKSGGTSVDAIEAVIRLMEGSGLFNLETAVGSQKSAQALGAPDKIQKCLITTEVTTTFCISPCTPISCTAFLRPTAVSRFNAGIGYVCSSMA